MEKNETIMHQSKAKLNDQPQNNWSLPKKKTKRWFSKTTVQILHFVQKQKEVMYNLRYKNKVCLLWDFTLKSWSDALLETTSLIETFRNCTWWYVYLEITQKIYNVVHGQVGAVANISKECSWTGWSGCLH